MSFSSVCASVRSVATTSLARSHLPRHGRKLVPNSVVQIAPQSTACLTALRHEPEAGLLQAALQRSRVDNNAHWSGHLSKQSLIGAAEWSGSITRRDHERTHRRSSIGQRYLRNVCWSGANDGQ